MNVPDRLVEVGRRSPSPSRPHAASRRAAAPKSQNNLEEGLLRLLKSLLPEDARVIVLADRGFGRAELARACGQIGLHFLIRIKPDAGIRHPRYRGLLRDLPVKKGVKRVFRQAAYRLSDPVTLNVVVRWKKGLPAEPDAPWFLITDLPGGAVALTELYGRRMAVEMFHPHYPSSDSLYHGWQAA